eukprot:TRINITY_DN7854_c0_g1_i1.p1 TRINITY_DN7854_c0_g1~~TRINITY_DN7854_c0_g1_i1.p1  ORF type:complete len:377 (-),score=111.76 TRINITY_DN7854_c0_g1_i1:34-1164(-)
MEHPKARPNTEVPQPKVENKPPTTVRTLGNTFEEKVAQYEHRDFLRLPFDNVRWTFLETKENADMFAEGFIDCKHEKGTKVVWILPEGGENVALQISSAKIGSVFSFAKSDVNSKELSDILDHQRPTGLIWRPQSFHTALYEDMKQIVPEFDYYPFPYRPGPWWCDRFRGLRDVFTADIRPIRESGFITLRDIKIANLAAPSHIPKAAKLIKPEDTAAIYNEFENGQLKATSYSHDDFHNVAEAVANQFKLEIGDRTCLSLPLCSPLGHATGIWSSLIRGAFVVIPSDKYDPQKHLKTIPEEYCNAMIASPEYAKEFFTSDNVSKYNLNKLKKVLLVGQSVDQQLVNHIRGLKFDVQTFNPKEKAKGQKVESVKSS